MNADKVGALCNISNDDANVIIIATIINIIVK